MFRKILVATDFSDASAGAFAHARELARAFGAALEVIHVVEDPIGPAIWTEMYAVDVPAMREQLEQGARERLDQILTAEDRQQLKARAAIRHGSPHHEIVAHAKEQGVDLIVVGTHGRGAVAHMLMGSVAERVARHAPCPVLVVRAARS